MLQEETMHPINTLGKSRAANLARTFAMLALYVGISHAERLCVPANAGDCPDAVDIPQEYGSQEYCGDATYFQGKTAHCIWYNDFIGPTLCKKIGVPTSFQELPDGIFAIQQIEGTSRFSKDDGGYTGVAFLEYYGRARIQYTIKCQNGISYQDTLSFEQYSHNCDLGPGNTCSRTAEHPNSFEQVSLDSYNPVTKKLSPQVAGGWGGMHPLRLPEWEIRKRWLNRKVGIPVYLGDTNKLAVPLVLINGIGEDYTSWGVTAAGEYGSTAWTEGLVTDYANGSLPDVVSRAYGLAKGASINTNGIYFINLDYKLINAGQDTNALVDNTLKRLEKIAFQHVQLDSNFTPLFKMDLVCHSASCLVLNEALRRSGTRQFLGRTININDYIRNIVAVDAPHYGSALAKSRAELEADADNSEIGGLSLLHRELDGEATEEMVLHSFVQLDFSDLMWENCDNPLAALMWLFGQFFDVAAEVADLFGYDFSEFSASVRGGLLGPHNIRLDIGVDHQLKAWTDNSMLATKNQLIAKRQEFADFRNKHYPQDLVLEHPRRSDNSFVPYVAFYSDSVAGLENEIIKYLSRLSLGLICDGISDARCADFQTFAEASIEAKVEEILPGGTEDNETYMNPYMKGLVQKLRNGWFAHSDLMVEKSSQVWDLSNKAFSTNTEVRDSPDLKEAKTYTLHQSELPKGHPDYPVLHASVSLPFAFGKASPQMGKDLFCALESACDSLSRLGYNPLYTGEAVAHFTIPTPIQNQLDTAKGQAITLAGDFTLYPLNEGGELSGFVLQDSTGNTVAVLVYDKTHGTYVLSTSQQGTEDSLTVTAPNVLNSLPIPRSALTKSTAASATTFYARTLLPPSQRPQFMASRTGDALSATVIGQAGYHKTIPLGSYSGRTLQLVALSDTSSHERVVLVGKATAATPQAPLPAYGKVRVLLQDKKGKQETNTSRPWMWVANNDTAALRNLTLTYYFTADPARTPQVEMDYPTNVHYETVALGGDHYKFVVRIPELPAQSVFPGQSGLQIRVHYQDWTPWITSDDYSAGTYLPLPTKKVVLRDAYGRLLWGEEPAAAYFTPRTVAQRDPVHLELSVADAGTYENNMLRPKVFVKHSGGPALEAGFKVVCFWNGLGRLGTAPTLEDWYSPDTHGQIKRLANGRVQLEWTFENYRLYNGQHISIGDFGVHWPDWTALDKSGFATAQWVVLDAGGNVLLGEWPTEAAVPTEQPAAPVALDIAVADAGASEPNQIRPHVTLSHRYGPVLLAGYTVRLEFALPGSASSQPLLEKWYAPYAHGTLTRLANSRVRLEWTVPTYDLFAGQTLDLGEWGIHWNNWSTIDKTGLASAQVTVYNTHGQEVARYGY